MSCFCCACVSSGEIGIVEKFGKFQRLASPGLQVICWPFECMAGRLSARVQQLSVRTATKTKDDVTVDVVTAVQYRVINSYVKTETMDRDGLPPPKKTIEDHGAWRAYYRLTGVTQQFQAYIEDVVRSEIPLKTLDQAYAAKTDIAHAVKDALQKEMSEYGYEIVNALVTDISPDMKVQNAMNEINAAKRMRLAAIEKAEANKIMKVKDAEADAESKYLSGVGVSRQRKAIINGLKESVNEFQGGVAGTTASDVMQLVMMTQYLDTIKDSTAHGNSTLFIPGNPGGLNDMQTQVRQGLLESSFARGAQRRR